MPTTESLNIISPKLYPKEPWNESEVLGAITWLWYQSPTHRQVSIAEMMAYVLPVLKNGQFTLFYRVRSQSVIFHRHMHILMKWRRRII